MRFSAILSVFAITSTVTAQHGLSERDLEEVNHLARREAMADAYAEAYAAAYKRSTVLTRAAAKGKGKGKAKAARCTSDAECPGTSICNRVGVCI